tara:strand:- start:132 stop:293 length:162 start_codon:yes stop_codon:yes gene_type:complete
MAKKEYKLVIDYDCEDHDETGMDRVWLDTGERVIQLPVELLPYLEDSEILGIA